MTLEFQIYDWSEDHESDSVDDDSESEGVKNLVYIIHTFGRTMDGKSVYMKITDFHPYFYIKLPDKWDITEAKEKVKIMKKWLKSGYNTKVWNKYRGNLIKMLAVEKKSAEGFTNNKRSIFAKIFFDNSYAMKKFKLLFEVNKLNIPEVTKKNYQFRTFEANLQPMLRCFHNRNIGGCSWVKIDKYTEIKDKDLKESYCDIEINVNYKKINPVKKETNAPLRILSFDIECNSKDGGFPQARKLGDPVIQIGSTYTYLGKSIPYRQHIVCLKNTSPVENALVESYDTEEEMILAWKKEVIDYDCDIITGYNIFGFDESYIYDRCKIHLDLEDEILTMSKLKNKPSRYRNFKLASSAMGENKIKIFETIGRVHIDLMKDIQKTYNLSSYSLDSVSSHFIRDKIEKIEKTKKGYKLYCKGIDDIFKEDYIHIELMFDFISDYIGEKYVVIDIDKDNNILYIEADDELDNYIDDKNTNVSLWWSQTKDDVGPKDIFNFWMNGNDGDRSKVAKYCIKDCRLVNLLVNKLEVVTKNIEMSNVCFVPLSFLFTRGQGIKGFSLCTKVYQDEGYVFPVLFKTIQFKDGLKEDSQFLTGDVVYSKQNFSTDKNDERVDNTETLSIKIRREVNNKIKTEIIERKSDKIVIEQFGGYEGAIVFEPVPNVEYEALPVKDYASLYPSSMIQKNMSHETKVIDDKYDNIPGIEYYNAQFRETDGSIQYRRFAKVDNKLGVIPQILSTLLSERKAVKKLMKKETVIFKKKILDAKQLALKVTANSLYGCLGANVSSVKDRDIAACTTSTGREMLIFAKKYEEENIPGIINGIKHAYKDNNIDMVNKILNKEYPNRTEEFNDKIKDFVKNKINKIIFQPIIRYGDTDSIFSCYRFKEKSKKVSAKSILKLWKDIIAFSEKLISYFMPIEYQSLWEELHQQYYKSELITDLKLPKPPDVPEKPTSNKIILPIKDRLLIFLKEYMEESYLPWLWTLQDIYTQTFTTPKILKDTINVKLYVMGEHMMERIREFPNDITTERKKVIEKEINKFIEDKLKSYYIQPYYTVENDNYIVNIEFYKGGKKIIDKRSVELSVLMGIYTSNIFKSRLPYPQDLEYEKTYWPFLILTKKRYVGNKYEFDCNKYYQDFMGIVLKRRDNSPIVKEICSGIINYLINEKNPQKAKEFVEECLQKMIDNKYDLKYFLTSKNLKMKSSYVDWKRIAHMVLADRISKRDSDSCPQSGDRIQYAIVKIPNLTKKTLQGERIETPEYIKEKKLELDYKFYITNQIMKPALQFLELAIPNAKDIFTKFIDRITLFEKLLEIKSNGQELSKTYTINSSIKEMEEELELFNDKKV